MGAARNDGTVPVWADAAYLAVMGVVAVPSMLAALVTDGRTGDGILVWVLATASAYAVLYRVLRTTHEFRRAFRRHVVEGVWAPRIAWAVLLLFFAAIIYPVFAKPRATSNRGPSPHACLTNAFSDLLADSPDGRMPQMRTQREARERLAPYLKKDVDLINGRRARRKLPPITADYFWEVGGGTGSPWIFNPQISGRSAKELASGEGASVLVWAEPPRPTYRKPGDVCRWVIRLDDPSDCLTAEEWERVRPRF